MKIQNMIFSLVICLFACMPAALYCATRMDMDIPPKLTSEPAEYLAGGLSEANVAATLSFHGFKSKELQNAVETEIGNYIPAKAEAIIINTMIQRKGIEVSNAVFDWDCYPTFYGSERLYIPGSNAVTYMPRKHLEDYVNKWEEFAENIKEIATRFSDRNFVLYVVQGYTEPAVNPAYSLVSNPLSPRLCSETLTRMLSETENVHVLTQDFDAFNDYYTQFFTTDHHWNIDGAFEGYRQICETLELNAIESDGVHPIENYLFTGATARWGVDLLQENVFDCNYDFSNLSIEMSDGTIIDGNNHDLFWDCNPLGKPYLFYDNYYGKTGNCSIGGGCGNKKALLVGNSYKEALQRPLAESYSNLEVGFNAKLSSYIIESLEEELLNSNAEDVILVGHPNSYL